MGSPCSGSKVQTTMFVSNGNHQPLVSSGASLQLEKLGQVEIPILSTEKPSDSGAALSPGATEEQSITASLASKKMKRRTRSSQGLELNGVSLGAEEKTSLSSVSFRGHRRTGSGTVTPKALESPRAKGRCTSPGAEKYAVAKIAASLFQSPTKLERSMSLSRVAHRVVPGTDGRSRTGVSEVTLPEKRDTNAELKQQDSQRELENRLQAVVAQNRSTRDSCFELLEKEVEGSGAPLAVTGDVPSANGNCEDSHRKVTSVPMISSENPSHCKLGSMEDSWPNGEYLCSNGVHLPVKDIHPVCFETTNKLHTEQLDMNRDLHEIARSCSLPTVASPQPPLNLLRGSNDLTTACEPLHSEQQSGNLSNGTDPENSLRIHISDVLPVTQPRACEAFQTKVSACNQGNEPEETTDKVDESLLSEAAILSSLVTCKNDSILLSEESKQVVTDASQVKAVAEEIHFNVGLRETNHGSGACLRKSASFELGEKKSKVRKRRRSVSASGIGAMLLKIVRTSESEPPGSVKSLPRAESEVSDASPKPPASSLQKDIVQSGTEIPNHIEAVDMDIEYEDCSSELAAAADVDIACDDARVEDSSESKKDTKVQPSEEAQLQLVDDHTQFRNIQNCTEGGQANDSLVVLDSHEEDQTAGSGFNDKRVIISLENSEQPALLEERFLDARDKSLDRCNSFESIERSSSPSEPAPNGEEKITIPEPVVKGNGRVNGYKGDHLEDVFGGSQRRRRHVGSRARMPHDHLDSSTTVATDDGRRSLSLVDENLAMIASLERSRSFASMLQVSPRQSVDESTTHSRLAPSSIAILTNPSFSSSHQDRLWEEQAEYSSGGRGTPGRDDDDDDNDTEPVFDLLHTPSPSGGTISSPADDHQIRSTSASASLRIKHHHQGHRDSTNIITFMSSGDESKRKQLVGQSGRKRGRPQRSPLRSLLAAEDLDEKRTTPQHHHHRRRPFLIRHILSRIRGKPITSPRLPSSSPSTTTTTPKRRHGTLWSSCMCFSHVK